MLGKRSRKPKRQGNEISFCQIKIIINSYNFTCWEPFYRNLALGRFSTDCMNAPSDAFAQYATILPFTPSGECVTDVRTPC